MNKHGYGAAVRLAIISLALCGLVFPLVVTGFAQLFLPNQANGGLITFHGRFVGSYLIAQNFNSPMLFHPRNQTYSASGVDPDITLQDAYSQIPRIQATTGIPPDALKQIVDENVERTLWIAGEPYVNVLKLNLVLIERYPAIYQSFS
ncbi:MAG: potassium-transporting ATPase subunit C [Candidatus Bathyarchaeia archaeon]|jgi:K+-transporting ATPase ATPase C chain